MPIYLIKKNVMPHCYRNFLSLNQSINLHCDSVKKAPQSNTMYAFSHIFISDKIYL